MDVGIVLGDPFSYDSRGNRTLMADSTGRYTSTYDALNRVATVENPQTKTLNFTYDSVLNRRTMQTADSGRFTYSYDTASQLLTERRSGTSGYAETSWPRTASAQLARLAWRDRYEY